MITLRRGDRLTIASTGTADVLLTGEGHEPVALPDADGSVAALLRALDRPLTWQQVRDELTLDAARCDALARRLVTSGVLTLGCADEHGEVATARVHSRLAALRLDGDLAVGEPVQLSPYALLRRNTSSSSPSSSSMTTRLMCARGERCSSGRFERTASRSRYSR